MFKESSAFGGGESVPGPEGNNLNFFDGEEAKPTEGEAKKGGPVDYDKRVADPTNRNNAGHNGSSREQTL